MEDGSKWASAARHDDGCQCPECLDPSAEVDAVGDDELVTLASYERDHSPAVLS